MAITDKDTTQTEVVTSTPDGLEEQLVRKGEAAKHLFDNANSEVGYRILGEGLAQGLSQTLAITAGKPEEASQFLPLTTRIMDDVRADLASHMAYTLARERTRNASLRYIRKIAELADCRGVDFDQLMNSVSMYDMFALVARHTGLDEHTLQSLEIPQIQEILLANGNLREDDMFLPYARAMHKQEGIKRSGRSDNDYQALELISQLADATYALTLPGNITEKPAEPGEPRILYRKFDPKRLTVYPLSIQHFYTEQLANSHRDPELLARYGESTIAAVLTAFNLMKSMRTVSGDVLTPYLYQNERGEAKMTEALLTKQRKFSDAICGAFTNGLKRVLGSDFQTSVADIGSYGRGTGGDTHPDVDAMATNIPLTIEGSLYHGVTTWEGINTYLPLSDPRRDTWSEELRRETTTADGKNSKPITDLEFLRNFDPRMHRIILDTMEELQTNVPGLANVRFSTLKKWDTGMVFTITADSAEYGGLAFDMNLSPMSSDFGVEQSLAFNAYQKRVEEEYGENGKEAVVGTLETIRTVKAELTRIAGEAAGNSNSNSPAFKEHKVSGFIVESLITAGEEPLSYEGLVEVLEYNLPLVADVPRQSFLGDIYHTFVWQEGQKDLSLDKAIQAILTCVAISEGGYDTLVRFVKAYRDKHPKAA